MRTPMVRSRSRSRLAPRLAAALIALALTGVAMAASPASALTRNCNSSSAQLCLYYNSVANGLNAEFGTQSSVPSFNPGVASDPAKFKAGAQGSAGAGYYVWNQAAAGRNYSTVYKMAVFVDSNYTGAKDVFAAYTYGNLVNTKNDNASLAWGT